MNPEHRQLVDLTDRHVIMDGRILGTTTGRYVEKLLKAIIQFPSSPRLTVILDSRSDRSLLPDSERLGTLSVDAPNYSWREQLTLLKVLNHQRPDLVHFTMPQQPILYRGPTVTTFHDLTLLKVGARRRGLAPGHLKTAIGRAAFRRSATASNAILVPSEYTRSDLHRFFRVDDLKVFTSPEAGFEPIEQTDPVDLPDGKYILYVGRQATYKNIRTLMDVHQQARLRERGLILVLAGSLDADAIANREYALDRGYEGIHFTGRVSDANLAWLYRNCVAYVFPSLYEGFGLPGLEAMTYGAPLISSNRTCLPEVYGSAACYFDPVDQRSMLSAVLSVVRSSDYRSELIAAGYERARSFTWEHTAMRTLDAYAYALGVGPGRGE